MQNWAELTEQLERITPAKRQGIVVNVVGLTIEVTCPGLFVGELCQLEVLQPTHRWLDAEVVGFRGDTGILMLLAVSQGITFGSTVVATGATASVALGDAMLGRLLDACGEPIDGGEALTLMQRQPLKRQPINPLERQAITDVFATGVRVIDGMLTFGRGQRLGLFANAGVGKSSLLAQICRQYESSAAKQHNQVTVVVLVGERGREVLEFYQQAKQHDALKSMVIIAATAEQPPLMRIRAVHTGLAVAEYFSGKQQDVMLVTDSMTRFAMALREVGLASGEAPTLRGYTSSVFAAIPAVIERCGAFANRGAITGIFSVLVEGELTADPAADAMKAVLDGHIVLSTELAEKDHYPAVDLLKSVSRLFPALATPMQRMRARQIRRVWAAYEEKRNMIELGLGDEETRTRLQDDMRLVRELVQQSAEATPFADTLQWMERLDLRTGS